MNYIGSKHSLLPFLTRVWEEVREGDERVFCDLFAGTGAVGRRFKQLGFQVLANDLQYYAYVLNRAYIEINGPLRFAGLAVAGGEEDAPGAALAWVNRLPERRGFITEQYGPCGSRQYFTRENAEKADGIRTELESLHTSGRLTDHEYYYLLCSLLEAMDAVANTASIYGAFLKRFKGTALRPVTLRPLPLPPPVPDCRAYHGDANELIEQIECDVLYLDPPYNHRQYGANYHVLETLARYDAPEVRGTSGLRPYERSRYCRPREVKEAFSHVVGTARTRHILVSYNDEGLMSLEEIRAILSRRGEPKTFTQPYNRYKADKGRVYRRDATLEYLHYVRVVQ